MQICKKKEKYFLILHIRVQEVSHAENELKEVELFDVIFF